MHRRHLGCILPPPPPPDDAFQLSSPDGEWCLVGQRLGLEPCSSPQPTQWKVGDAETGELELASVGGLCIKMREQPGWSCANKSPNETAAFCGHCSAGSGTGAHRTNYFFAAPTPDAGEHASASVGERVAIRSNDCPELCLARVGSGEVAAKRPGVGLAPCAAGGAATTWVRQPSSAW